ncbi:hypothetical protein NDU88_002274 [Pleurodeles waltl]|uniref:Uncharacterized protein n=1 Tax=Pleurodeles waltl TaxID=8319 RepID=A0AAV7U8T6_PLEWA|nr:hypothetical protein NDU88_002274 [Pleurodeles waltl]
MLADIRRSLAVLAAPTKELPVQASPNTQGVAPVVGTTSEQGQVALTLPGASQDPTTQALLAVSQMLANINAPTAPPPPMTPWASDSLQNSVQELKRQVEALATARNVPSLQVTTPSPCVSLTPGSLSQNPPVRKEHVMLEKKPETGIAMICYANKILKAHHMYGGNAWLEYDRDFRWAKVEDPAIGWDQTEVNVWLECVNNKLPSK